MPYRTFTRDEHFQQPGPKRILALDGGGLRGIVALCYLERIEAILRKRHGNDPDFRLGHYFDLVAGTSTGAIIAAGLAIGLSVAELIERYLVLGRSVFKASVWRQGKLRYRYDEQRLIAELKDVFGDRRLGDDSLSTGLLVVTKRLDSGSPWPLANNPRGRYFAAVPGSATIANADYPLWQVVRASTAAPTYFVPERITIARAPGKETVSGSFVDGGVSPYNNPALQALMYATLDGFRVRWPLGEDRLLLVSVGTGAGDPSRPSSRIAALAAVNALKSLMDDCGALSETMLQWLSSGAGGREIDRELGDLRRDLLAGHPALRYRRYQLDLTRDGVDALRPGIPDELLASLAEMDRPANLELLRELGERAAAAVKGAHFPTRFDLPREVPAAGGLGAFRRREDTAVTAVPLRLKPRAGSREGEPLFTYHKWGAKQTCKSGDWLVHNGDSVYTVDRETFDRTYEAVAPGRYRKVATVWAERASHAGEIRTREGVTHYRAGDWLVYNDAQRRDGYAVSAARFDELYEPAG